VARQVLLFIDGAWAPALGGDFVDVVNPATEETIAHVASATIGDLDRATEAAQRGFAIWRHMAPAERSCIMRRAAEILRSRIDEIARLLTVENGKPLSQARLELASSADMIEWFAEEGRRAYGRLVPARAPGTLQMSLREPIGPVAAFTPWNFPVSQVAKKLAAALAAGCSIIVKGPEETPASPAELIRAFEEAGIPPGVINLVYGVPANISGHLVPHRVIRKVSFTGSTAVGKQIAALAGAHMKRSTMELGGHAPALVFADADLDAAAKHLAASKFRNAGQVCIAPTRLLVQSDVHDAFVDRFLEETDKIIVGDGMDAEVTMGPLVHERRLAAVEAMIQDATAKGADAATGGRRIGNKGYFLEPTVLVGAPKAAEAMNREVFGPVALINRFSGIDAAIEEANRLPYGLAAYAFTRSTATAQAMADSIEAGVLGINHMAVALAETPFGGIKESGHGSEGGAEGLEAYLATKFVTQQAG
jgi:succinate-semialdehyde dehydrogenase/glutarate-semialdehyde dehydrogenase